MKSHARPTPAEAAPQVFLPHPRTPRHPSPRLRTPPPPRRILSDALTRADFKADMSDRDVLKTLMRSMPKNQAARLALLPREQVRPPRHVSPRPP